MREDVTSFNHALWALIKREGGEQLLSVLILQYIDNAEVIDKIGHGFINMSEIHCIFIKLYDKRIAIMSDKVIKTDEEWIETLTPEQYEVTRKKGTDLL